MSIRLLVHPPKGSLAFIVHDWDYSPSHNQRHNAGTPTFSSEKAVEDATRASDDIKWSDPKRRSLTDEHSRTLGTAYQAKKRKREEEAVSQTVSGSATVKRVRRHRISRQNLSVSEKRPGTPLLASTTTVDGSRSPRSTDMAKMTANVDTARTPVVPLSITDEKLEKLETEQKPHHTEVPALPLRRSARLRVSTRTKQPEELTKGRTMNRRTRMTKKLSQVTLGDLGT
ncbi:hypothetical protein BU15DRAFT_68186 [Melanogaster broomeanus]|nr:hypothetical protein BU15DRAFT_68186 [Melanogaster broomeanus]